MNKQYRLKYFLGSWSVGGFWLVNIIGNNLPPNPSDLNNKMAAFCVTIVMTSLYMSSIVSFIFAMVPWDDNGNA